MTTPSIDTILARVAKLQALANDPGATAAEAELAAEKLQQLLDKYNLSMEQVKPINTQTKHDVEFNSLRREGSRIFDWELQLLNAVCYAVSCQFLYTSYVITFVGLPADVVVAKQMYVQFLAIAQHLATRATKDYADDYLDPRELRGVRSLKSFRLSYLLGFSNGLYSAFVKARKANEQAHEVIALVLVKEGLIKSAIAEKYPKLGKGRASNAQVNNHAYSKGYQDGANASNRRKLNG